MKYMNGKKIKYEMGLTMRYERQELELSDEDF